MMGRGTEWGEGDLGAGRGLDWRKGSLVDGKPSPGVMES